MGLGSRSGRGRFGMAANAVLCCAFAAELIAASPAAHADDATPFYKGKTIRIVISTGVAGGYAEYARLLADHMGAHIAGQPSFIVQSMPGAGGLLATNYLYSQAPQDGTTIGIVHSSVPLTPLWGNKGVRFDTLKFNWLGSLDRVDGTCVAWHTSPIKTWSDMLQREFTVGSSGAGSQMDTLSGDPQPAVRDQGQGGRRLQGRDRCVPRHGTRRGRGPLRRPDRPSSNRPGRNG